MYFIPIIDFFSNGIARSGTVIALDRCMRQYEDRRTVDVLQCVFSMRQERAGCVQTAEHYSMIYQVRDEVTVIYLLAKHLALSIRNPPPPWIFTSLKQVFKRVRVMVWLVLTQPPNPNG